jgi:hypothetical protein
MAFANQLKHFFRLESNTRRRITLCLNRGLTGIMLGPTSQRGAKQTLLTFYRLLPGPLVMLFRDKI